MKVALVGCGGIAAFHVAALRHAGFTVDAVCGRAGSQHADAFAREQEVERVYDSYDDLLNDYAEYDALVIAVPPESTPKILRASIRLGLPILVEKPVSLRSESVESMVREVSDSGASVIVGFNRRFYRTSILAKRYVNDGSPVLAHMILPDDVRVPDTPSCDDTYLRPFYSNSVHGLDLARFVLGDLEIVDVQRMADENNQLIGIAATLRSLPTETRNISTAGGSILQFTANWCSPTNFSFSMDRVNVRFEMRPFESARIYDGMEVIDPTTKNPIRSYTPKVKTTVGLDDVDERYKPGFVRQAQALSALVRSENGAQAARLDDAYMALKLAEDLAGRKYQDGELLR